jgi:hypothetical protein
MSTARLAALPVIVGIDSDIGTSPAVLVKFGYTVAPTAEGLAAVIAMGAARMVDPFTCRST